MSKRFVVFCLVMGVVGSVVAAQKADKFQAGVGLAVPFTGDLEDFVDTGFMLGAQYLHYVEPRRAFGVQLEYMDFGESKPIDVPGLIEVKFDANVIVFQGIYRYDFQSRRNAHPFLMGGVGLARMVVETETTFSLGFLGSTKIKTSDKDTGLTFGFGGGFDIPFQNKMTLGLQARYQQFLSDLDGGALVLTASLLW